MFYVYRFLDKHGKSIYVGKTSMRLDRRFGEHVHLPDKCYAATRRVEYIECQTRTDMTIREVYYINLYYNDASYNLQDVAEPPEGVTFSDDWIPYDGPLPEWFSNSINVEAGSLWPHTKDQHDEFQGKYLGDILTPEEVAAIAASMANDIKEAEYDQQYLFRLRNLTLFAFSVNTPLKGGDIVLLKYGDVFDKENQPIPIEVKLGRKYKDAIVSFPIPKYTKKLLEVYRGLLGYSHHLNASCPLFISRKGSSTIAINRRSALRIIKGAAASVGLNKNITLESLRKTYGLNIYSKSENKAHAIFFLEKIFGASVYASLIKYLGLVDDDFSLDSFFNDEYELGDLGAIVKCLTEG